MGKKSMTRTAIRPVNVSHVPVYKSRIFRVGAGIVTAAASVAAAGAAYYALRPATQTTIERRVDVEGLPGQYVERVERIGNDPNKKDVYIVLQRHSIDNSDYRSILTDERSRGLKRMVNKRILENQVAIYRVIEGLANSSKISLVTIEGYAVEDLLSPGDNPPLGTNEKDSSIKCSLNQDQFLMEMLKSNTSLGGAELAAMTRGDIYLSGWDDRVKNNESSAIEKQRLLRELILITYRGKGSTESAAASLVAVGIDKIAAEYIQKQAELLRKDPARVAEFESESDKLRQKFERLSTERSICAITSSSKLADKLHSEGKTNSRGVAVVIGTKHQEDYKNPQEIDPNSNFILVWPRGLKKD